MAVQPEPNPLTVRLKQYTIRLNTEGTVIGTIILRSSNEYKVTKVACAILGTQELKAPAPPGRTKDPEGKKLSDGSTDTLKTFVQNNVAIAERVLYAKGDGAQNSSVPTPTQSQQQWKLNISLPKELPSSFERRGCPAAVRYFLKAVVETENKGTLSAEAPLTVIRQVTEAPREKLMQSATQHVGGGRLTVKGTLSSKVLVAGDKAQLVLTFDNWTKKDVTMFRVDIIEVCAIATDVYRSTSESHVCRALFGQRQGVDIPAYSVSTKTLDIVVPTSVWSVKTDMFSVFFVLNISVTVSDVVETVSLAMPFEVELFSDDSRLTSGLARMNVDSNTDSSPVSEGVGVDAIAIGMPLTPVPPSPSPSPPRTTEAFEVILHPWTGPKAPPQVSGARSTRIGSIVSGGPIPTPQDLPPRRLVPLQSVPPIPLSSAPLAATSPLPLAPLQASPKIQQDTPTPMPTAAAFDLMQFDLRPKQQALPKADSSPLRQGQPASLPMAPKSARAPLPPVSKRAVLPTKS
mmetsp:Transcript_39806/g.64550  ORF Transcript_39806/g.64550 Transcript_39806/m.64550 type:complete len:517 (+) Transcript_39806:170-1720(+)|eukprot:CAMPEP_0184651806 /NCGR_PEP_ID=MMETSP0308-20130426/9450_1 /TAXON_ID=38269 /ORGANISM="Gloeochaete witrockiana, Strain SAG 46.84" /LENGTH=516 /DNA_ID=CAMNT_0027086269 /DNA_START=88 /DNA_END=1638 /DNA_ORIENTATION=-